MLAAFGGLPRFARRGLASLGLGLASLGLGLASLGLAKLRDCLFASCWNASLLFIQAGYAGQAMSSSLNLEFIGAEIPYLPSLELAGA